MGKLPDAAVLQAMAKNSTDRTMSRAVILTMPKQDNSMSRAIDKMEKNVVRAIKNIPQTNVVVPSVMKRWIRSNGSINDFL